MTAAAAASGCPRWFFAFENATDVDTALPICVRQVCYIAHEPACDRVFAKRIYRGNGISSRQRHDDVTSAIKERLGGHDDARYSRFRRRCESVIHLLFRAGTEHMDRN